MSGDLSRRLAVQRGAHQAAPLPAWPERADRLRRLRALVRRDRDAIAAAIAADFGGRSCEETLLLEVFPSLGTIDHALARGRGRMRGARGFASRWFLPARTELLPHPLGVAGIIVPWNYPLYLAVAPLVDALAAGNRAMLKLSERAPRFAACFAAGVARDFDPAEVDVVQGDAGVAAAFAALPFDHLFFTGSARVGREVMRAAAANLVPVTLELGGKSPAIIAPGARLRHAVERILVGKAWNAGQTCIAPDYVLLPRDQLPRFIDTAREIFTRLYPDFAAGTAVTALVDDAHHARLLALRDQAVAAGATAHPLAAPGPGRRMPTTLLCDVPPDCEVMREEIFGPLLPLLPCDDLDAALAFVAARPSPLALYLFDDDRRRVRATLARVQAGGVTVNDSMFHIAQQRLPFGGVGASGMGACHGEAGFRTFSHHMPVLRQSRLSGVGLFNPPYGKRWQRLIGLLLR